MMKSRYIQVFVWLLCGSLCSAQVIIDTYKTISEPNDSTWLIQKFDVYETSQVLNGLELVRVDTVLDPGYSAYYDSAGIIQQLVTTTAVEQDQIAGKISRAFDSAISLRNVADANTLIDDISADSSNYFEETAKLFQGELLGRYRVFYDSAGVQLNQFADLTLRTTPAHPDGRSLRLTFDDGQFWAVQAYHWTRWRIVNWPYGEERFCWHRISPITRPLYRPEDYSTREDKYTRLIKVN